ncbi:MAG: FAD-dependent oxidoreductase, partial [Bacteroidota bacterium]
TADRLRLDFTLKEGVSIVTIDRKHQVVVDDNGEEYPYDRLIIATGSRPFVPRDVPLQLDGVFTMRHRSDADGLRSYLQPKAGEGNLADRHVLIVGGGLLGLELAAALREINVRITIVQRGNRLMERQLDATAAQLLAEDVRERGIQTYFRNEVNTVFPRVDDGKLTVTFKSGKVVYCDVVVYAIGTRPNLELARAAGLECGRGIAVDDRLCTSDRAIYAIGEVAEWRGQRFGITAAAEQQADTLANSLSGDLSAIYQGSILMNILKFESLDLCSIGQINYPREDPAYEEIIFQDISQRYYKKCIIHQDRLVGAILLGDKNEFAEFRALIEERIELSEKRQELLRSGTTKEPLLGRVVCSCNNTGEGNLTKAIRAGCHDFKELCNTTGAGLGCGSCKPEVRSILEGQLAVPS